MTQSLTNIVKEIYWLFMDELIVFSVFEITQHLKQVVETQIEPMYVRGEISNFTHHSSGHIYFNLKDPNATLRCTFFRFANMNLSFSPEEGMEVVCFGKLTVYEKGGTYNLNVQSMTLAGKGDLAQQFELLKKKLQQEGLFAPEHKQALPRFPRKLGIVTSPTGAALQDMINVLSRRYPITIDVYPALVQGPDAPAQLIAGVQYFNAEKSVDVIILARGGGSQEDLFCFNDEGLARAVFASRIPIVSAVGHEIDFSIADFVADLRAPTPSAAAELVTPDRKALLTYLGSLAESLAMGLSHKTEQVKRRLSETQLTLSRHHPERFWQQMQMRLDLASIKLLKSSSVIQNGLRLLTPRPTLALNQMQGKVREKLLTQSQHLKELSIRLANLAQSCRIEQTNRMLQAQTRLEGKSPMQIMKQGYSIVQRGNEVLSSVKHLHSKDELLLRMYDGSAKTTVTDIIPEKEDYETR